MCALDQADLDSAKCLLDFEKALVLYHFLRPSASPIPGGPDSGGSPARPLRIVRRSKTETC
jgi:hypothetical protein